MFAKIATRLELEVAALLVEDVDAGHVGREQVRRELDRRNEQSIERAIAFASIVLPTPGTSSIERGAPRPSGPRARGGSRGACPGRPSRRSPRWCGSARRTHASRASTLVPPPPPPMRARGPSSYRGVRREVTRGSRGRRGRRGRRLASREGRPSSRPGPIRTRMDAPGAFRRCEGDGPHLELLDAPRGPFFATSGVRLWAVGTAAFPRITPLGSGRFKHPRPGARVR